MHLDRLPCLYAALAVAGAVALTIGPTAKPATAADSADAQPAGTIDRIQAPFNAVRGFVLGLFGVAETDADNHPNHASQWGYHGTAGPDHWGDLDPGFATCAEGKQQSPIDLTRPIRADIPTVSIDWQPVPVNVLNNGHTIQVSVPEGSHLTYDGRTYALRQFHFHHPSEHEVDGVPYPLELHFVHVSEDGKDAVVLGVFIEPGDENPALAPIWAIMPRAPGAAKGNGSLDPTALLPADRANYDYAGSLTTPPCTEMVQWIVFRSAIKASPEQIRAFTGLFGNNARPVQDLNRRRILSNF